MLLVKDEGKILRQTYWDSYRVFLFVVYLIEIGLGIFLAFRLQADVTLYSYLRLFSETNSNAKHGSLISVSGEPKRLLLFNSSPEVKKFADTLEREVGLKNSIFARGNWKHWQGSAKSRRTVVDLTRAIDYIFFVQTPQGKYWVKSFPDNVITQKLFKLRYGKIMKFSPRSSWVEVDYFNPKTIHVLGVLDAKSKGGPRITSGLLQPLIFSELPLAELKSQTFFTSILLGIVLVYLIFSFFCHLKIPLKESFDRDRHVFFVLDRTGGSEKWAIALIIVFGVLSVVVSLNLDFHHFFSEDRKFALFLLGFFALVHVSKDVEFFYLASREGNALFEISRGYFRFTKKKISSLGRLQPTIKEHVGGKGEKSYSINSMIHGVDTQLTDAFFTIDKPKRILAEFEEFRKTPLSHEDFRD